MTTASHEIRFLLNGEPTTARNVPPTQSVLHWLRENQLTGTKEGCAEGDCGACTVVIGELNGDQENVELKTVNACIQFVPTLHGKALFTVESLRQQNGDLHPVQQAMVNEHGSQCGFCTPGFVMSLWNLYNQHQAADSKPSDAEARSALTGNLCRCTGYRPILAAAQSMFDLPAVPFERECLAQQLTALQTTESLNYAQGAEQFFAPKTLAELLQLRAQYPQATMLAGGTDVGLWVNKQFRALNPIIYVGDVAELKAITAQQNMLVIGAGATLTDAYAAISKHYPEMDEMWERFASMPIRNSGTLGGNVANGSPIGDSMPALIALGANVVLQSSSGKRTLLMEDFYLDYMKKDLQADEIVVAIELPLPDANDAKNKQFRCYKHSKRYDSDISAVFAAFSIEVNGDTISACKIAYGGMAATPKRASNTEQALLNQPWNEANAKAAMQALAQDFTPLSDMRASADNRLQIAQNLLYRFYLETRADNPLGDAELNVFAWAGANHE